MVDAIRGILDFKYNFDVKVTIYTSRTDGQVRPKEVFFALHQIWTETQTEVYGRLTVDVGRYHRNKAVVKEVFVMQSRHSVAPKAHLELQIVTAGSTVEGLETDTSDDNDPHPPALSEWDKSHLDDAGGATRQHRPKSEPEVGPNEPPERTERPRSESTRRHRPKPEPSANPPHKYTHKRGPDPSQRSKPEPQNKSLSARSDDQPLKPPLIAFIISVFSYSWDGLHPNSKLDASMKFQYPVWVFPLFAMLRHSQLLVSVVVKDLLFEAALDVFFDELEHVGSTPDDRFLTGLVVALLVDKNVESWSGLRVSEFLGRFVEFLNESAKALLVPSVRSFEVVLNRFATAQFDVDQLLEDFRQVLIGFSGALNLPQPIARYLFEHLAAVLDAKMLNKLIINPTRYMFATAVQWNTLVTALDSVAHLHLTLVRQALSVLMMAQSLTEPDLIDTILESVCPNLEPPLIMHLLRNYQPDEMMPQPIDCCPFAEKFGLNQSAALQAVRPITVTTFRNAATGLDLDGWNKVVVPPDVLRKFPFLVGQID
jgi:hypothetical protein